MIYKSGRVGAPELYLGHGPFHINNIHWFVSVIRLCRRSEWRVKFLVKVVCRSDHQVQGIETRDSDQASRRKP